MFEANMIFKHEYKNRFELSAIEILILTWIIYYLYFCLKLYDVAIVGALCTLLVCSKNKLHYIKEKEIYCQITVGEDDNILFYSMYGAMRLTKDSDYKILYNKATDSLLIEGPIEKNALIGYNTFSVTIKSAGKFKNKIKSLGYKF